MHRRMKQSVEAFLPGVGRNEKLERIDQVVDWKKLAKLVNGIYASPSGRPSYPPVVMVKTMVLQQWYDASDEAMEEALWDRISFKRFVGLGIEDDVPRPLDDQPVPQASDGGGSGAAAVQGTDPAAGAAPVGGEEGDADRRNDSRGAGAQAVVAGASGGEERDRP